MTRTRETFERLATAEFLALREAALAIDPKEVSMIAGLRRRWSAELVAAALELAAGRRKSRLKFPNREEVMADPAGVEQATSERVAAHKATRFRRRGRRPVVDLCCGIGGDAMALAESHEVLAIDRDPIRAWMCGRNAKCETETREVEAWLDDPPADPNALFHLDPARRVENPGSATRQRVHRFEGYQPAPEFMSRLVVERQHGAIKLGPGVDLRALPWSDVELELITDGGELVQCVAWFGDLATDPGQRRATLLPSAETTVGDPRGAPVGDGEIGAYLFQANAALERAQLVGELADALDLREIAPGLGLLTGASCAPSPWLTAYEVIEAIPWRVPRIRDWLTRHGGGLTVVKTRGGAVDANRAARELRGDGPETFVVFALRIGRRKVAVITKKI